MVLPNKEEFDPLLLPFLAASDESQADAGLSQLISRQTDTIKQIIRAKLRVGLSPNDTSHENQEALELVTDVQTTLLSSLQRLRLQSASKPIGDFGGYVAKLTFNACNQFLRSKYPKRLQLKNKLRYLLTHEAGFALWQSDKDWLCGLADWANSDRSPSAARQLQQLLETPHHLQNATRAVRERQKLCDLLANNFRILDGPVLLDQMVSLMIDQLQIQEDIMVVDDEPFRRTPTSNDSIRWLEHQAQLKELWTEICELPLRHRSALLLNLRDRGGEDALELFVISRATTIREIARVLDIEPQKFARVWSELPWDDATIANHLRLTRQQVINLRQSARAKLARRKK